MTNLWTGDVTPWSEGVTPWFEVCNPIHHGVYQRDVDGSLVYSYWDGVFWYFMSLSREMANINYSDGIHSYVQTTDHWSRWRGLLRS